MPPPLARAAAHPRLTTVLASPCPTTLRACRYSSNVRAFASCSRSLSCRLLAVPSSPQCKLPSSLAPFHSSCHRQQAAHAEEMQQKNHYERLGVRTDASPAEIKKKFYSLSKAHHPDANPNDPAASHTFSLLSESYTVLSDPPRRAAYDRDTLRLHAADQHHHHHPRSGSYHSAGGRPASGLSRRRGTFRGPPPSFYRSGGWGAHSEKRRAAHESSTTSGGETASQQHGGMGPGSDPFGHREDVPHFDKRQHTKTHEHQDERRSQRSQKRSARETSAKQEAQETGMGGHFLIVSGVLGAALLAPMVYFQLANLGKTRKER